MHCVSLHQGELGATGLRGSEGAPGIGTQGEKVQYFRLSDFLSVRVYCDYHLVDVKKGLSIIIYSIC